MGIEGIAASPKGVGLVSRPAEVWTARREKGPLRIVAQAVAILSTQTVRIERSGQRPEEMR